MPLWFLRNAALTFNHETIKMPRYEKNCQATRSLQAHRPWDLRKRGPSECQGLKAPRQKLPLGQGPEVFSLSWIPLNLMKFVSMYAAVIFMTREIESEHWRHCFHPLECQGTHLPCWLEQDLSPAKEMVKRLYLIYLSLSYVLLLLLFNESALLRFSSFLLKKNITCDKKKLTAIQIEKRLMPLLLNGQVLELLNVTACQWSQEMQSVSLHVYSKVRVCQLKVYYIIDYFVHTPSKNKNRHLWHRLFFILLKRA